MAEAIAAGLVALALLFLVLQPLLLPSPTVPEPYQPPDAEETARGRALLALKEIEFDRATGKLSDEDFATLSARYQSAAIATLAGCAQCGGPMADRDRFCGRCGRAR
ncbi:MAG: hypothetical protein KC544_08215 [Gemmatimonadetes bacterium]|nr:hypothetical protein [Gemmatimonadota bacterium]MCA9763094.1 hypothetical protein [Gemmatimonadota bacterium]MCA9769611.1 hypothetical protein [Gemmatimonadota bacterium]MCB9505535.1 hypothetical protein [Gemmatimonadales bacterium]MCB9518899.1 hypothetical protein [Gemmatimonadales bacterium]